MNGKTPPSPQQALSSARMIWMSLLLGQILFLVVVIFLIQQPGTPGDAHVTRLLFILSLAGLLSLVPLGYLMRIKTYDRGRGADGAVTPQSYLTGNILLLAMAEGPALLSIVGMLLSRDVSPFILVTVLALAVQAINFPTGSPLRL
jgi:hypothetical protein